MASEELTDGVCTYRLVPHRVYYDHSHDADFIQNIRTGTVLTLKYVS